MRGCTVSAPVTGDSNTGGIVGTVALELGSDPEETFTLDDMELLTDVTATLRAVVRDCRFDGAVTAKNDCAGGIAGRVLTKEITTRGQRRPPLRMDG